jgi:hypothetical protein
MSYPPKADLYPPRVMLYAADRMRHDGDITHGKHRKDGDSTGDRTLRLPVPEAAGVMGISAEAVRQRIKRGTLPTEKDAGGTVFVLLSEDLVRDRSRPVDDSTRKDGDITDGSTRQDGDSTALIESLQEQVEYLKETVAKRDEEIRRQDHLLAAALERIPAIEEAPSERRESPMTASEEPYSTHAAPVPETPVPDAQHKRSWWRSFFFGP